MLQQYEDEGTVTPITGTIHNELSVQLNKSGYDKREIKRLYKELAGQKEYQHNNGKPHKTNIRRKIQERMTFWDDDAGQWVKPSMKTIKRATC